MNKLGFGFLRLPKPGDAFDWDALCQMTDCLLAGGGRYFDTCYTYLNGNSELGVKKCVAERYPRDQFLLAEKLPGYLCKKYEDAQDFFDQELARCGVEYFDVFMLHWLNGKNYQIAQACQQFRFLSEKKAEGRARRIGFSYHDSADLLEEILTAHPEVDVVQLQINYLDWDSAGIESRKCYEVCVRHGKKIIVMEPVKGGTLASLPEAAEQHLRRMHPQWSPADWALRFVQSLPQVEICLSGMSTLAQVEENLRPFAPLTEAEVQHLMQARGLIESQTAVACTGCRYCVSHCPRRIAIPEVFRFYNEICRYPGDDWKIRPAYLRLTHTAGGAEKCVGCKSCEAHCPQRIPIPQVMKQAAEKLAL